MVKWGNDRFAVVMVGGSAGSGSSYRQTVSYGVLDQETGQRLGLYDTREEANIVAYGLNHGV